MCIQPYLIDVLESQNHTSSENESTSSPDSLTSEPISFVAPHATSSTTSSTHSGKGGGGAKTHGKFKSATARDQVSPVSSKQTTKSGASGKNSVRTSSPKNVPGTKGGQRSQQQFISGSVSPVKGRSRSPKQHQRKQLSGSLSSSVSGGSTGSRMRGEMRHAVSFDQGFSPLRSYTVPQSQPQHHHQPLPTLSSSSAFELLAAQVSGQQQQPVDNTVRRLFSPDTSVEVTSKVQGESAPTSLQSIFSQVTSASSTSSNQSVTEHGSVLPLKMISLEQVEKQMVEDVPSPVSLNPLALFGGKSSHMVSTSSASTNQSGSLESNQRVLLQPSAFMSNTSSQPSGPNDLTGVNPPVNSVAISVEPPSPMVAPDATLYSSAPGNTLKGRHFPKSSAPPQPLVQDQFFPPIPPLMHSPGMRAAPVSHVNPQQHQQQQPRGEPSSLGASTASAYPPSTQTELPPLITQPKTTKELNQQVSSTTDERPHNKPELQSTPQRFLSQSSQSTPSVS